MVTYKIMSNCFAKSTCHQTKVTLKKGDPIYYVKSSDDPTVKDHRAYSPESQMAEWLRINGTVIPAVAKSAPVKTEPAIAPVMASMLHDEHPAPLVKPAITKSPITKSRAIVMKSEAGTMVFYPAR